MNGARAEVASSAGEGDQRLDLIGLAAETKEEDCGEVGVGRIASEDAAEQVGWFIVLGHSATGAVGDRDDSVHVG